jgi:uncharacterized membrane protein YfcA
MSLVLQSSGGGQITIQEPATASNFTQTLPAATGDVMVSGNMPAFSAFQSSAQTLSNATTTKITFTTEVFDTNNNFASSTFTPTVAGYYQINCGITVSTSTVIILFFFKNGSAFYRIANTNSSSAATVSGSNLIYLNGSTDYVEVYAFAVVGSALGASQVDTYFSGSMVRAA